MLPELVVAPPDRRGRRREHERRAPPGCSTCATGDWSTELCDAIGVDRSAARHPAAGGNPVGIVAGGPRPPRRRPRHRVRGPRRSGARRRLRRRPAPGCSSVANRPSPDTSASRRTPPGSATSRARWAASGSCATSPGWWLVEECRRDVGRPRPRRSPRRAAASIAAGAVVDATRRRASSRPSDMAADLRRARRAPDPTRAGPRSRARAVESMAAATAQVVDVASRRRRSRSRGSACSAADRAHRCYLDALRRRTDLPVVDRAGRGDRVRQRTRAGRSRSACSRRSTTHVRHSAPTREEDAP